MTDARRSLLVLLVAGLGVFMVFLDTQVLFVAFGDIRQSFPDVSATSLSWVLSGYTLVFAALLVPSGRLADRWGRKRVFLGGLTAFTVASVLCGLAPSAPALIVARLLQAAGAAALTPASLALVLRATPRERIPDRRRHLGVDGRRGGRGRADHRRPAHRRRRMAVGVLPQRARSASLAVLAGRRMLDESREADAGRLPRPRRERPPGRRRGGGVARARPERQLGMGRPPHGRRHRRRRRARRRLRRPLAPPPRARPSTWRCSASPGSAGATWRWPSSRCRSPPCSSPTSRSSRRCGAGASSRPEWPSPPARRSCCCSPAGSAGWPPGSGHAPLIIPGGLLYAAGGVLLIATVESTPNYATSMLPAWVLTGFGVALDDAAAVERLRAGAAVRPLRPRFGGQPDHPPARRHVRRGVGDLVHRRRDRGRRPRPLPPTRGG